VRNDLRLLECSFLIFDSGIRGAEGTGRGLETAGGRGRGYRGDRRTSTRFAVTVPSAEEYAVWDVLIVVEGGDVSASRFESGHVSNDARKSSGYECSLQHCTWTTRESTV
jgi:hypothetical protein